MAIGFSCSSAICQVSCVPTSTPDDCVHDGDVNQDGTVTAGDASQAFYFAMGYGTPSWEEACAADCNGNGLITAEDAQFIFSTALGIPMCVDPVKLKF